MTNYVPPGDLKSDIKTPQHYIRAKEEKRLPFPIPLVDSMNQVQYPLDENINSVVYFNCFINLLDQCCDVTEEASIQALYHHGFFGKGSLSSNSPIYEVIDLVNQRMRKKELYLADPLLRHFPRKPDIGAIIDDLHRKRINSSRSPSPARSPSPPSWMRPSSPVHEFPINGTRSTDTREYLKLTLEEAFFLAYGLGVMTITDPDTHQKLNLSQIWNAFCSIHCAEDKSQFAGLYAAYHYFRGRGWVVKTGNKFASELIIYDKGPSHTHALFSVNVFTLKTDQSIESKYPQRDWLFHVAWVRVGETVRKHAVQCFVLIPSELTDEQLSDPRIIKSFEIQTILMRRFEASQERQIS